MTIYHNVVFLPLLGAIIAGLFGRSIGDKASQVITSLCVGTSAILSGYLFYDVIFMDHSITLSLLSWMSSGDFVVDWSLRFDSLTAVMLVVVTSVSFMVHVYSIGYMHHDTSIPRFQAYLSLFTFFMLMLVTADNLVQLFFGWEGVGLASYLLIGFWYEKPSACAAAIKAFIVNRVGDFGFALGIFGLYLVFGTSVFNEIFQMAASKQPVIIHVFSFDFNAITVCCCLLLIGAMGKSAQLGLHTWLPDAMEGPTPVSALIHAATMVTAGVFMLARMSPLFEYSQTALAIITVVGALTAIFAATVGCVQNDIKRIIAYSTCSQLGYMFFAIGVSAYQAGIFHLFTHAFFKALLFLGAGSVIHAMSDEQDIRKMGGIWKQIPLTYALMVIGSLALAGIPPFAGHYSKDAILESAWASHTIVGHFAYFMGIMAAFLTAFYSTRLLIMTFHGQARADEHVMAHVHESPLIMTIPLIILSLGAIFAGWLGVKYFVGEENPLFWAKSIFVLPQHSALSESEHVPTLIHYLPLIIALSGIGLGFILYWVYPKIPAWLSQKMSPLYKFLLNKWYFDEIYNFLFVKSAFWLGKGMWKGGDGDVIDACGPDGLASATQDIARRVGGMQSGYLYHYAFAMLIGVAVFVTWYVVRVS
jgi:NADH-quinone oxidoreductase subunit L